MDYAEWLQTGPEEITGDSLWKMEAYRLALFAADLGWHDATRLGAERRTMALADQVFRAVGSVSTNLAEGYSRGTGRGRAHFYECALGFARESRDWYYRARHVLQQDATAHHPGSADHGAAATGPGPARQRALLSSFP
jgi:four helix bundle protein